MRGLFPRIYDLAMGVAERWRVGRWRRAVVAPADGLVIDIGAGTGLNFPHYRRGVSVIAIDPDLRMLARAKPRAAGSSAMIALVAADAEALPFRAATFDTSVVALAMCTIPRPTLALSEIRRVLRRDGTLRMLEHVRLDHPVLGRLQDWVTPLWRRIAGGCHLDRRTVSLVAGAGFSVEVIESEMGGCVVKIHARPREG